MSRFENYINEKTYFGNQAVGVIIKSRETGRILVVKRSKKVFEGGTYSITVSGKVDNGESAETAAYREVSEELRYKGQIYLKILDVFQDFNDSEGFGDQFKGQFTFFTYLGLVGDEFTPRLNWESRSAFWWDGQDKIKGKLHSGTTRLLKRYRRRLFR